MEIGWIAICIVALLEACVTLQNFLWSCALSEREAKLEELFKEKQSNEHNDNRKKDN